MSRGVYGRPFRFAEAQRSYWEAVAPPAGVAAAPLTGDQSCDVAIIGGGYTGLSSALHLARDYSADVRVLEAGHIGWGASGRNAGFCCPGGTGLHGEDLVRAVGVEQAREFYAAQLDAVALVRTLVSDESIDCGVTGDAELCIAHTQRAFERLGRECELLADGLGLDAELVAAQDSRERFFACAEQRGALLTRPAFGLDPLRYCRGLAAAAERRGAILHAGSEVVSWSRGGGGHRLVTDGGVLRARQVILATNAYVPESLHQSFYGRTIPVVSAILVTRPLSADELAAHGWITDSVAINSRRVLNYFRLLPGNRLLFGGRGGADEERNFERLDAALRRLFPHWSGVAVDYRWHGLICMTARLCPSLGSLEEDASVMFAFGYHGNGVNNATWAGARVAALAATGRMPRDVPGMIRGLGARFRFASLRGVYRSLAIFAARQLDRVS